jgi:hypothetical protein
VSVFGELRQREMQTIVGVEHQHRMAVLDRGGPDRESVRALAHGPHMFAASVVLTVPAVSHASPSRAPYELVAHSQGLRFSAEDLDFCDWC